MFICECEHRMWVIPWKQKKLSNHSSPMAYKSEEQRQADNKSYDWRFRLFFIIIITNKIDIIFATNSLICDFLFFILCLFLFSAICSIFMSIFRLFYNIEYTNILMYTYIYITTAYNVSARTWTSEIFIFVHV